MRDQYDFSDAVKNPFAGKFNGKYTVKIHYDFAGEEKRIDKAHCEKRGDDESAERKQA